MWGKNGEKIQERLTGHRVLEGSTSEGTAPRVRDCWYGTVGTALRGYLFSYLFLCLPLFFPGSNPLYSQMKMYCMLMSGGRRYGHSFRDLCLKFLLFLEVIFFFCPLPPPPPPQYLPPSLHPPALSILIFLSSFFFITGSYLFFICCNSPSTSYF